ncbi:hypothetical protein [Aliarcobacter butzleri]|uniref:hypothetical protein n=1 Tax=Aliarcobacter butzleri TaxID=28197 RepID=UPI001EDB5B40|nr:hypothetical protein [Aliarcobacter butzleri]MCG3693138.1 hypothetical protein [Aliarcobacter butzleri]
MEEWLKIIVVTGSLITMICGLRMIYERLKSKNQGFGGNSLKAIGVVLFIPTIIILSIVTEFQSETLAALLGTIAGYVLSDTNKPD